MTYDKVLFDNGISVEYAVSVKNSLSRLTFSISISFLVLFISPLYLPSLVSASGFTVRKVGSLNVDGLVYSHLWYTNGNVAITGGTLPNNSVTATVDGAASTVTADASGNWSYTTTLAAGDHAMSFSSISSTVSFTLTIGALPEGVGGLPTATAPTVGNAMPTIVLIALGGTFIILPLLRLLRKSPNRLVE